MDRVDRRSFLKKTGLTGGAVVAGSFIQTLTTASSVLAAPRTRSAGRSVLSTSVDSPYGPLAPVPDQNGDTILALPPGFSYVTFSKTGAAMSDGTTVPRNHDGMGAFVGPGGTWRLIRNHEVRNAPGDNRLAVLGPQATKYDPLGGGGTVTLDYDFHRRRLVRDFVSLNGTIVNCAGGI
ncbi:MAG: DUF839 domain-containing protein [Acidimicrobiales bacterium]|nr:DUF839 domain-containing protein [Acidimicrobiales bacterium]